MRKIKKPTNQFLFDKVIEILKKQGKLPNLLDYNLHEHNLKEFSDYQFNVGYMLDYGGNEGIYLDVFVKGICDETQNTIIVPLGIFKTLQTSEEAMVEMGKLAGHFTYALSKYVNSNLDDFTWKGYDINFYKEDDAYAYGYSCTTKERALQRAEEHNDKYVKVILRDNQTRDEIVIK